MIKIHPQEFLTKISKKINRKDILTKITEDRNKLLLTIFVILVVLCLDFFFGLRPQMRALGAINPKIARLRKDLKNLNSDLIKMQRQETGFMDTEVKKIASSDQIAWVIEEVSRLANEEEVKIFQMKPVRKLPVAKTLIDLEVSAGYHQLGRFLAALENHSIFLEIGTLDIERNNKDPFEHKIRLKLKTYVSK
ncbi:MAG: type 4a pilus biogenesis protein PilO [Candidatus Omnitrophica bacterium]|nr:type 4a pilus biogenesis protein PilO [Candidatus Omnitrophota bacterium]